VVLWLDDSAKFMKVCLSHGCRPWSFHHCAHENAFRCLRKRSTMITAGFAIQAVAIVLRRWCVSVFWLDPVLSSVLCSVGLCVGQGSPFCFVNTKKVRWRVGVGCGGRILNVFLCYAKTSVFARCCIFGTFLAVFVSCARVLTLLASCPILTRE